MKIDIYFDSADAAVAHCRQMISDGTANLFRGQINDWPTIAPSLFRGSDDIRTAARAVLNDFFDWAGAVPQMAAYHDNREQITAIAQHYGIPTTFLDLTTSPEIAELFARASSSDGIPGEAVIYCFDRNKLKEIEDLNLIEISVQNLWRIEAQHGLFLEYLDERITSVVRNLAVRLHFPRKVINLSETVNIYPIRKSALEIIIDQWIYRNKISQIFDSLTEVKHFFFIRRYTYPGVFKWRNIPEFDGNWVDWHPGWIYQPPEHVSDISDIMIFVMSIADVSDVRAMFSDISSKFRRPIENYYLHGKFVEFIIKIGERESESRNASIILNRCWDGIRVHPYSMESAIRSMSATVVALAYRVFSPTSEDEWEQALWGKLEHIDTSPVGGHLEGGSVSKSEFIDALHSVFFEKLTDYVRNKVVKNPLYIMDYVVDPRILFDFRKFSRIFIEQFVPSCIGWYWKESLENNEGVPGELWGLSFNAALLGFVTRGGYRFHSPISMEGDVGQIILISSDMEEGDIEELFVACLPSIFLGGEPYTVKFIDYSRDEREVWQIPRVIEQCCIIEKVSGISVLDVFPGAREVGSEPPSPWQVGGMGAFHIWAIARNRLDEVNGEEFSEILHIIEEFMADLALSNKALEARARARHDWPADIPEIRSAP